MSNQPTRSRRTASVIAVSVLAFSALFSASTAMASEKDPATPSAEELQAFDGELTTGQLLVLSESQTPEQAREIGA